MKNFPSKKNHVKVKRVKSTLTAMEKVGVDLSKAYPGKAISPEAAVDSHRQLVISETSNNIHSARQSSYSEAVQSLNSSKAPSTEDRQMPQDVNTSQSAVEATEEVILDSQVDGRSCVNKDNGSMMMRSDLIGDADYKDVTASAASISSFCPAGLENSVMVQSASGSSYDPFSVKEGTKSVLRACKNSGEAVLETVDFPERCDPTENSSFRDDQDSTTPGVPSEYSMEQVVSSLEKVTDSNILGPKFSEGRCVSMEPETGLSDGNPSATVYLNGSDRNEYLKYDESITNNHEPPLESRTAIDNDGSVELVDVRVCDICGDVGREALLALCSNCTDGAEHIYCMRIKMDKVPEGDWMCEDCMMMQEQKTQTQTEGQSLDSASNVPYLKDVSRDLPTTMSGAQHTNEPRTNHSSKSSCFYGKRRGSEIDLRPALKRKTLERSVQPLKSSGSGGKMLLSQVSSPKIMDKGKEAARQVSSSGNQSVKVVERANSPSGRRLLKPRSDIKKPPSLNRGTLEKGVQPLKSYGSGGKTLLTRVSSLKIMDKSKVTAPQSSSGNQSSRKLVKQACSSQCRRSPKPQEQFCGGKEDLRKRKSTNVSDSNIEVRQPREDDRAERTIRESGGCQLTNKRLEKKLFKSMSFAGVSSVPSNVSNAHLSHAKNVKDMKDSSGRNSTENYDSVENKSPPLGLPLAASGATKVNTSSTTLSSETAKAPYSSRSNVQDMKNIQVDENTNVEALGSLDGQNFADTLVATSVGEDMSPSPSSYGITSAANNLNSYPGSQVTQKPKLESSSGADNGHLVASDKVVPLNLHPVKELPGSAPVNVVPSAICAVPEADCIWKGAFELEKGVQLPKVCSGIQAHLSTCASTKVFELVHKFRPKILLKEVPRLDTWPIQFQRNHPVEQDIAVYFFAEDLQSYARSYEVLLEGMIKNDLALEANFDGVQLLVFSSSLLPARSQRWNGLSFLWGVFRVREVDYCGLQIPRLNVANLSGLCIPVSPGTQNNFFPALEAGSFSASHNSTEGPESVDPVVLHSSASTKSMDQSFEHEVSSVRKCLGPRGALFSKADALPVVHYPSVKEMYSGRFLHSDDFQTEDGYTNKDTKSLGKDRIFRFDWVGKENMVPSAVDSGEIGLCSDENYKLSNFPWTYDSTSKFCQEKRLDLASGSSFSFDSGPWPSGSSDGGGCAKSDDGQVEQLQNPASCGALNLDLCLRSGSEPEGHVDLDLVLGTKKYQFKHCAKDRSSEDRNVSLVLSLGKP